MTETWLAMPDGTLIQFLLKPDAAHIDFNVYDGIEILDGPRERSENVTTIDGMVKWDGCINWQSNPHCMVHGCGPHSIQEITNIFTAVYVIAKRHFDLLGDDVPPMPEGVVELDYIPKGPLT